MFSSNGIIGSSELQTKFEKAPIETAISVVRNINILQDDNLDTTMKQLAAYSENQLNALSNFLRDIQLVARLAEQEEEKAKKELAKIGTFTGMEEVTDAAIASLDELCGQLECMEVYENAAN